jgi:hypothetical protein
MLSRHHIGDAVPIISGVERGSLMNTGTKRQLVLALLGILLLLSGVVSPAVFADEPPDALEVIRQAAANYYPNDRHQYHISADNLYDLLHDGDPTNNPLVVSVQSRVE